ncbi:hypothetical protein ILUMI_12937, partial [Ignelater luminosus]
GGSRHIWKLIRLSRCFSDEVKAIVYPAIQRNAWARHPERILLSMITDDPCHICELGLHRVLRARKEARLGAREFVILSLNFILNDYVGMIDWQGIKITESPLLSCYTDEEISASIKSNLQETDFLKFPCHSQAVERCVKMVTEASEKVCGSESKDGFIAASLQSRRIMPFLNTKSDYNIQ